jgi:hypothetical protein
VWIAGVSSDGDTSALFSTETLPVVELTAK